MGHDTTSRMVVWQCATWAALAMISRAAKDDGYFGNEKVAPRGSAHG
jgi:hypothetical protein